MVQAWGDKSGSPYKEYNTSGVITYGPGPSANLNYLFNLTIKASLNSQGQITSAWIYIANAKTGQIYFSQTINSQYLIPDKQVFFDVEDPLNGTTPTNFPIIPSSNYIFIDALASNSSVIYATGLPLYNGVEFVMEEPKAVAFVLPMFGCANYNMGPQGVLYYWRINLYKVSVLFYFNEKHNFTYIRNNSSSSRYVVLSTPSKGQYYNYHHYKYYLYQYYMV
jgi:hypothetical protein